MRDMACTCGANSWGHVGATQCGSIRCTACGHGASPEDVKAYRKKKSEAKATKVREEEK